MNDLLEQLADRHRTYIQSLRQQPGLKWEALGDLYCMENKEQYPLPEQQLRKYQQGTRPCRICWAAKYTLTITKKSGKASSPFLWR